MAQVCNRQQQIEPRGPHAAYLESEGFIEAGSAHFVQAFSEALGLNADLELHNILAAKLRLQSISSLLKHALRQYVAAMESGSRSGLNDAHDRRLWDAGLDYQRARHVLDDAVNRGFLRTDDEQTETLARNFEKIGTTGLMSLYMAGVREILDLAESLGDANQSKLDSIAWQELGWRLTTLFSRTLEFGKAIAVLNIFTFRLPIAPGPGPTATNRL